MSEPMVPVRYVGPAQRGIVVGASRVHPPAAAGVINAAADQADTDARTDLEEGAPVPPPAPRATSDVEVLEHVALALVARGDFEPVGWEPPTAEAGDQDEGDAFEGSFVSVRETAGGAFPVHRGGGHYELSDGTSVQGRDAAVSAQADLDQAATTGGDTDDGDGDVDEQED